MASSAGAPDPFGAYLRDLRATRATGQATEHSYRPAVRALIEALGGADAEAADEPAHGDCGAPDFIVQRRGVPIGGLGAEQFADLQAQTAAYGLFAARCLHEGDHQRRTRRTGAFTRQSAAFAATAPFLRGAVLQRFGWSIRCEDAPVVQCYENFLAACRIASDNACVDERQPGPAGHDLRSAVGSGVGDRLLSVAS